MTMAHKDVSGTDREGGAGPADATSLIAASAVAGGAGLHAGRCGLAVGGAGGLDRLVSVLMAEAANRERLATEPADAMTAGAAATALASAPGAGSLARPTAQRARTKSGRERRRRGLRAKLHRGMYGAMLWASHGQLVYAQPSGLPPPSATTALASPAHAPAATWLIEAGRTVTSGDQAGSAEGDGALAEALCSAPLTLRVALVAPEVARTGAAPSTAEPALGDPRLSPGFSWLSERLHLRPHSRAMQAFDEASYGMGLDVPLPEAGRLHLMVLPEPDALEGGKRWAIVGVETDPVAVADLQDAAASTAADPIPGSASTVAPGTLWSLGTAVDVAEIGLDDPYDERDRERRVTVTPQLLVDADRLLGMRGDAVVTLQRAYWRGDQATMPEPVMQLRMRWRF